MIQFYSDVAPEKSAACEIKEGTTPLALDRGISERIDECMRGTIREKLKRYKNGIILGLREDNKNFRV